uniref:Maturase K n=1 Tax=Cuscuta pedicellata TaxID=192827 RepID=A0A7H0DH03_9ASTE|nr:maturase K [Cuscuta pedicellata]QNP08613.1 maturase K [Cuscuta pedicellata]
MYQQIQITNYYSKKSQIFRTSNFFYSNLLAEVFAFILEIPFYLRFILERKKNKLFESKNLRSIHSIFPFFEDNLSHLNLVLDIRIPYPPHLEIVVQIIRDWVKDASSLHLLRFFLYEFYNCKSFSTQKRTHYQRPERLFFLLYNSYLCQYESIFVFLRNQSLHLKTISFVALLERNIFYVKSECLLEVFPKDFHASIRLFKAPDLSMHYGRYRGKSIIAAKSKGIFILKWNYYIVQFWESYFSLWFHTGILNRSQLSIHSFSFMDYLSSIALIPSTIRSQMLENSFLINNPIHKLETLVPIISILGSLAKAKFCNVLGNPISKAGWTDLSDSDIIKRFARICRNLFHYYSGSSKKTSLYQIKYILRLSCARTLARKHKSTVRNFLQSLGSEFLEEFFTSEEQIFSFTFLNDSSNWWRVSKRRIWYFDIVCIKEQVNF